ncbi:hypothetical protein JIG36_05580 [Actinoplanes sp. LDG1-06]|uniref:Glycosyltransferase RgtA/B/C/D-like domain-containing protein n=1 Tax=Paractinoplanes ovalisporus TaxID=2810368 RepID=A0ABS2A5B1_9ACTN|nr:hypothetical protein [Actinoplanes ovalisporus]MBM2615029.1 hypothetical protein [Actinoplanes ovalisporus]
MTIKVRVECGLAALAAVVLAAALTWPALRHPATTIPGDLGDPTLQAWQVAWAGNSLHWWDSNTFFPAPYSFVYSDMLLGYAPAGWFGDGVEAALVRYNLLYVGAYALAAFGAYVLTRQLGVGPAAAAVAGIGWAFAPWRLAHSGHLNVLSIGGIALCLALLLRGHVRRKPWTVLAGWLVAAWQVSLGFGIGLPLAYGLVLGCLVLAWPVWRLRDRRLLAADLAGGAVFALTCVLLGRLYLRVVELNPQARRGLEWTEMFAPPLRGYLVAPADSWLWGDHFTAARESLDWPPEMALMPGAALIVLGMLGVFWSVFRWRYRLLLLAGVWLTGLLGLGTDPGYLTLSRVLPGWDALRTPGRLMIWISLLLAVLAAGLLGRLRGRWRALIVLPLALVLAEGVNRTPHPEVPVAPAAVRAATGPFLVLPSDGLLELNVMLWTTDGFPQVANGLASFEPDSQARLRQSTTAFPDAASVALLRETGIRSVVVLPDRLGGTAWEGVPDRPVDGLGITREEHGDGLVYRIS